MILRNRIGVAIATATLGAFGLLGLAACGATPASAGTLSPEQSALTEVGFTSDDVTTGNGTAVTAMASATPSAAATKDKHRKLKRLAIRRLALRGHVQHGQVTVETKKGDQTIDVQRGTVTAITATTMTVKSTDGYTLTWNISGPLNFIEHRTSVQPSDVATGDLVGVAGTQDGTTATAKLVVIPNKTPAGS
jgi:hypothetical protein